MSWFVSAYTEMLLRYRRYATQLITHTELYISGVCNRVHTRMYYTVHIML